MSHHTKAAALAALLALWGCSEDVNYNPTSGAAVCVEGEPCEEGSRPCRADTECPGSLSCNARGLSTDDPNGGECVDQDDDGFGRNCTLGSDCDDNDFFRNPLASEICNGLDDNCDGVIDDGGVCDVCEPECDPGERECINTQRYHQCREVNGCPIWLPPVDCSAGCFAGECLDGCDDSDGDGRGENCELGPDCDDRNPFAYPGNPEVCDGFDNNCNGTIDEGVCAPECPDTPCLQGEQRCLDQGTRQFCTLDNDNCLAWSEPLDCGPGQLCDQGQCVTPMRCVADEDGDGFGFGCPDGFDCNDYDPDSSPTRPELACDGRDNNCDGRVDEGGGDCGAIVCDSPEVSIEETTRLPRHATGYGYACRGRSDYHELEGVQVGATVALNVWQELGTEPVALDIVQISGGRREVVRSTTNSPLGVTILLPPGERFQVAVRATQGQPHLYALSWSETLPASCDQEPWEPNNSPSTALPILPNTSVGAVLCTNDLDFYQIEDFQRGQTLHAELTYGPDVGPLLLEIWRDGEIVTPDRSPSPGRRVAHFRGSREGNHLIVVRSLNPIGPVGYALSIGMQDLGRCNDDDEWEGRSGAQNDAISRASDIASVNSVSAVLCTGDLDFYDIGQFSRGQAVDVTIDFNANQANLDAYLFREDVSGLYQLAISDTSPEILPTNISQAGRYYVLVIGRTPLDSATYTLRK